MQNSKTVAQTLLGETAHFSFCPPKIGFFRGQGVPKFYFQWNPYIFVTQESMQNSKTLAQTLHGVTVHFVRTKSAFLRGQGGLRNFFSSLEYLFSLLRSPCKNLKSYDTPLCHFSNGGNNNKRKKEKNSASADGGPRSRVCTRGTLHSAPHPHWQKFSGTHVCRVHFTKFPHFPVKIE